VSDLHCGSTVALCPDEPVELDDGGRYTPSDFQRWEWHNCWLPFWKRVKKLRKRGDRLVVLSNGDLVDGDHHGTPQIITRDPAVQFWVAKAAFAPVLALNPDEAVIVRGTETHVGKGASAEESFARWLSKEGVKVQKDTNTGMYSHWHLRAEIGGALVDAAHHGRIGGRTWTKHSVVSTLAAQIVLEHANRGETPPALALRSHYHTHSDTHEQYITRLIQTPAWQIHTAFAHKVVPEVLSDIGGIIVTIEDGRIADVETCIYAPKRSPRLVL
jgi:hypothetical protein